MDLIFYLLILAFLWRCELLVCHSELCRLFSGSYSKIHDSSPVMTCLKKNCHFRCVQEGPGKHSFCFPSVHSWGILEPTLQKFSACPIPWSKCRGNGSVIHIHLTTDHSDGQTSIRPHESPHFSHIFVRFWRASLPEWGSSSTLSRPSKKALCHLKTCALTRAPSP